MLRRNATLRTLDLRYAGMTDAGAVVLAAALEHNACLELLDARYNPNPNPDPDLDLRLTLTLTLTLALTLTLTLTLTGTTGSTSKASRRSRWCCPAAPRDSASWPRQTP